MSSPLPHAKSEATRAAILRAATAAFAELGEAGARTDAIARAAGVNKALLHYHFGSKEELYAAVLDEHFSSLTSTVLARLNGPGSAGERLLRHFLAHFDHLAHSGTYAQLMGQEMMRFRTGQPSRINRMVQVCFGPIHRALTTVLEEGIASGELRQLSPSHAILSLTGANVFYFISAPFFREISGKDPRDPDMLARQRTHLLEFAAAALFADPGRCRALAARIRTEETGADALPGDQP
jgi:TetR/AcrR family transcriptional regulator